MMSSPQESLSSSMTILSGVASLTVSITVADYWGSIDLNHPAIFDTPVNPETQKALIGYLKKFVGRKEYYKRVGKAWKREHLLYEPRGTGKSSLVAPMANYLKFDI
ncbi:AAA-ATPase, partial [Cucurbita argyrosperma subsp. argyrosperma]